MNAPILPPSGLKGRAFSRIVAGVVVLVSTVVIAGWAFDKDILKRLVPGMATMKANAALCFIFCGISLFALQSSLRAARRIARVCALVVGAIALATLIQEMTGQNFGMDQILFQESEAPAEGANPGRMAPNSAIGFVFVALGLFLMSRPQGNRRRTMILLCLGSALEAIGLLALLGYVVGFDYGYSWVGMQAMAVPTAALFAMLGGAVIAFAGKEAGARWVIGKRSTIGFVVGVALLVAIAGFSQRTAKDLVRAEKWVKHTYVVLDAIQRLEWDVIAEENALRGFVITGDDMFLKGVANSLGGVRTSLDDLGKLTPETGTQREQLVAVGHLIAEQEEHSRNVIALRKTSGFQAAADRMGASGAVTLNDRMRAGLRQMEAHERNLLLKREENSEASTESTLTLLPIGLLLSVVIMALGVLRLNRVVAERQSAADALRRSERGFRLALDAAQIGNWELDLITHVARRSLKHDQIFGYSELLPEWTYEIFLDHVHPDDRDRVDRDFQESMAVGRDWAFECRVIRRDGTEGWIWARGGSVKDDSGRAVTMLGMVRDITKRKQAEEEAVRISERLKAATTGANVGIWDYDVKHNRLVWDDAMYRLYGISAESFSGAFEAWEAGVHPDDREREGKKVQLALSGKEEFDTEFRVVWPDKSVHYIKAKAVVQRDGDGNALRMIGTNWDITARKEMEENLVRAADDLRRSNSELEQFAYIASHDLQEPLRMVVSYLSLIDRRYRDKLDEEGAQFVKFAVDGGMRMQRLIRDLLAFSRIGREAKPFQAVELNSLLESVLKDLQVAIAETGATVTNDAMPTVRGDPTQLGQLFQNLVMNGIKFRSKEPVKVHISAERLENGWRLGVRDNGIGIEPQYFERIFVIFQRLHGRDEYPGTGIGLAVCKKIVERHGGQIWVESKPGAGTVFFFTLADSAPERD